MAEPCAGEGSAQGRPVRRAWICAWQDFVEACNCAGKGSAQRRSLHKRGQSAGLGVAQGRALPLSDPCPRQSVRQCRAVHRAGQNAGQGNAQGRPVRRSRQCAGQVIAQGGKLPRAC
jgi:hypothetical protein